MKNKKALSEIVTTMLIIVLTIAAIAIIWGVIYNFSQNKLEKAGSCYNTFEKVFLEDDYTCYNASEEIMQFSISRKDIQLDYLLVSISMNDSSKIYRIYDDAVLFTDLKYFSTGVYNVSLPGNESGKTYLAENISEIPVSIEISPNINNNQCEISSKIEDINYCI